VTGIPQFRPGEPTAYQVYTTFSDITARREAELRVEASERALRAVFDRVEDGILVLDPDTLNVEMANGAMARLLGRPDALAQGGGDLGVRLRRLLKTLPPGPVVVIGSDTPSVTPADIARAFHALGAADAVFGPARDGGYWLIYGANTGPVESVSYVQASTPASTYATATTGMASPPITGAHDGAGYFVIGGDASGELRWSFASTPTPPATGPTYLRQRQSPVRSPSRVRGPQLRQRQRPEIIT
jgi:glycosyltransferase A (GT-A) superfamily protein (DUF2064 family)